MHVLTGADIRVVAPFNAQVNRLTERLASVRRAGRNGGQVPGTDRCRRDLLDDDVATGRRTARHGVSLQPQSASTLQLLAHGARYSSYALRDCSRPSAGRRGRCISRTPSAAFVSLLAEWHICALEAVVGQCSGQAVLRRRCCNRRRRRRSRPRLRRSRASHIGTCSARAQAPPISSPSSTSPPVQK